ncbi:hypothetical protein ACFV3E_40880 [Streptomyces sp. NPDC059718]
MRSRTSTRSAAIFFAAITSAPDNARWMEVTVRHADGTTITVTGEATRTHLMNFKPDALEGLLDQLTGALDREDGGTIAVTVRAPAWNPGFETWGWNLPGTHPLTRQEAETLGVSGQNIRFTGQHHHLNGGLFGHLECAHLTLTVKKALSGRGIAQGLPELTLPSPCDSQEAAGHVLRNALAAAGITSVAEGDGSGAWVAVNLPCGASIWVNGNDNETDYLPRHHSGWLACYYPTGGTAGSRTSSTSRSAPTSPPTRQASSRPWPTPSGTTRTVRPPLASWTKPGALSWPRNSPRPDTRPGPRGGRCWN